MQQVLLMIGTRKGAFLAFSDPGRKTWEMTGPFCKGVQVDHVAYAPDDGGGAVVVTGTSAWWGPGLQISTDLGETWQERSSVRFAEGREHSVERIWITKQARRQPARRFSTPAWRRRRCFAAAMGAPPGGGHDADRP